MNPAVHNMSHKPYIASAKQIEGKFLAASTILAAKRLSSAWHLFFLGLRWHDTFHRMELILAKGNNAATADSSRNFNVGNGLGVLGDVGLRLHHRFVSFERRPGWRPIHLHGQ